MAIMSSKKEIAHFKKTIDKLLERVHHRTADLYWRAWKAAAATARARTKGGGSI